MTKQVLIDASTDRVLQWQDTGSYRYASPTAAQAVQSVTDSEWANQSGAWFVVNVQLTQKDPHAPTAAQLLADAKEAKLSELRQTCYDNITSGFASSALGSAHTYPSKNTPDNPDQLNLAASVLASTLPNLPSEWTIKFWCADSTGKWAMVAHTASQIQQVGIDGKAHVEACQAQFDTLTQQAMAASSNTAVKAVAWSQV